MDHTTTKRLSCDIQVIQGLNVIVANGDTLKTQECCTGVRWEVQGQSQVSDFFVLPLQGCDLVLGIQCPKTLGPITWDFSALSMVFKFNGKEVVLKGIRGGTVQLA